MTDQDMLPKHTAKCVELRKDDVDSQADVLCKMEQLLGTSRTRKPSFWSNKLQEAVMHYVGRLSIDALIVRSTHGGKSMTFLLRASLNLRYVSIVFATIVALQADILQSCLNAGIRIHAVTWAHCEAADAQIVLVSAENVIRNEYMVHVKSMHCSGHLAAFNVDEAHIMEQWVSFRPCVQDRQIYICP